MPLHLPRVAMDVLLQAPARGIERVAHRDVQVFVRVVVTRFATGDDVATGSARSIWTW